VCGYFLPAVISARDGSRQSTGIYQMILSIAGLLKKGKAFFAFFCCWKLNIKTFLPLFSEAWPAKTGKQRSRLVLS